MTTSTITSIEKYVLLKNTASGQSAHSRGPRKKTGRSSGSGRDAAPAENNVPGNNRVEKTIGKHNRMETRLTTQNQVALALRGTDHAIHQVGILINRILDDLRDGEIKASAMQLKEAVALIRRHRDQLKSQTGLLFSEKNFHNDVQEAECKSLFIGKHLNHYPDKSLTTTPSILMGYLN